MDAIRYSRADRSFAFISIVLTKKSLAFDAVDAFALSAVTYKKGYTTEEQLVTRYRGRQEKGLKDSSKWEIRTRSYWPN